ncbi:formate dehydrogenase subunit gamma [Geobacter pelophilus]|uniref:Formate dehydrogenase subunit gamma n=1 Tax=Geoanaerobacter pelophilus TaxID=60036 RepID=A0AAW4KW81_9BACT|nr:formate dehydrogenase subunit gamma [Geoanaerobacter pelophilus]MBT0662821.1 formate dehydrogenase subunit gamma [Geoanaerobacter pelophilus]
MKNDSGKLLRFTVPERVNHWLVALTFFLMALSGLVFFQPLYYPLNQLFGGGTWARILHPFFGVAMIFLFGGMFFRFWKVSLMTAADKEWLRHLREIANGDERNLPEAGKLNGGQKLMFWSLVTCMALLILSGIVIWRAYFSFLFPAVVVRFAAVLHAAAGVVMIALIMGHIYIAIWTRESIGAMLYGRVRRAWAKQHHPAWYREMTGGDK